MTIGHPRPQELHLTVTRTPVDGACGSCGAVALAAYPVLEEHGWFNVVKCQVCLASESRVRGPLLGYIELLSQTV